MLPSGRLAPCSGPAFGPTGSSFHAKGYGFLSVTRFLVRLCEFCLEAPTWTIQMMTDNQGLLTRIEASLGYPDPFPTLTLASDWDVTHKITCGLRSLSTTPILKHVKGHQDSKMAYTQLPLDAQLNVDADMEAGFYQCTYPGQRPVIPRLASNPVQLHIGRRVISSQIKQKLRDASTVSTFLSYSARRFHWGPDTAATVDWPAYTQAIG